MTLHFNDLSSIENRETWWERETVDCAHTYRIPNHNMPEPKKHIQFKRSPRYAVDIGTNVGAFSAYASPHFQQVYGFEALSQTYDAAVQNLSSYSNVHVQHLAVDAESNKKLRFYSHNNNLSRDATCSTLHKDWDHTQYEEAQTISLDDIYTRYNIDYIDYLKVDCEGSEYAFLMNKDLSRINFLVVEIHQGLLTPEQNHLLHSYLDFYFELRMIFGYDIFFYESRHPLNGF